MNIVMSHLYQPASGFTDTRNNTHDLIKGIAVLLMVQVHVMELFALPNVMDSLAGQISMFLGGPPVAPVFMVLLGFYALRPPLWPGRLLWRAATLLLLGGVLNVGLNLHLLTRIYLGQLAANPLEYLLGVDILLFSGLSLIVMLVLQQVFKANAWAWLLASVVVAAATPWMTQWAGSQSAWPWLMAFVASPARWSFFPLFPWLAYPMLGVAAFHGRNFIQLPAVWRTPLLALGMVVLALTSQFAVATSHTLPAYYHHDLRFFLWTSLFLVCWLQLWHRIALPAAMKTWLCWFGQHVTAFYVVQWLLIGNLATAIYQTQSLTACLLWVLALVLLTRWLVMWLQHVRAANKPFA